MAERAVVRPVRPSEHQAVADLTVSVYSEAMGGSLSPAYRARLADVASRAREAVVLVAVDRDERLLGSITYVPGPASGYAEFSAPDEAGVRMLVVAPEAQRQGVGTRLVQACADRARAEGRARISLHTTEALTGARRLYEHLGFRRAPERDRTPEPGVYLLGYLLEL
ncbi:MAG: GNAT family N-acetyltransferase [Actinomycetota bacterium]